MAIVGGIAGLTAAWKLSRRNIDVELVEKSCFLGGIASDLPARPRVPASIAVPAVWKKFARDSKAWGLTRIGVVFTTIASNMAREFACKVNDFAGKL